MSSRNLFLLLGSVALLTLASVALLNLPGDDALDDPSFGGTGVSTQKDFPAGADEPFGTDEVVEPPTQVMVADAGRSPEEEERHQKLMKRVQSQRTHGMISGRVALDTRVLDRLNSYAIQVTEEINPNARRPDDKPPFRIRKQFAYDRHYDRGTPYFDIDGIPFSEHGYVVRLLVPGLNGSRARTHVTRAKPVGEVELVLTPGVIFTVLLRDQRQVPRDGLHIQMIPEGAPHDRPVYRGKSDNYGAVVLEGVVQGDYKIYVGRRNAPMNVPEKISVSAVNALMPKNGRGIRTQSTIVKVPRGAPVTVEVTDAYSYPIAGAELEIHQIEVQRFFSYKGKTDRAGFHKFNHLPIGKYQVSVHKPGMGRRTKTFTIADGDRAKTVKISVNR